MPNGSDIRGVDTSSAGSSYYSTALQHFRDPSNSYADIMYLNGPAFTATFNAALVPEAAHAYSVGTSGLPFGHGYFDNIYMGACTGAGCGGAGTVTSVGSGTGLTGGPITGSGTLSCVNATSSVLGCVKVDGTTITAASGVISAVGGGVTTSGTPLTNYFTKFTSSSAIGNSSVWENGSTVVFTEALSLYPVGTATGSSIQYASNYFNILDSYWTGSVAANNVWAAQSVPGTGPNGTDQLRITDTGTTGDKSIKIVGMDVLANDFISTGVPTVAGFFSCLSPTIVGTNEHGVLSTGSFATSCQMIITFATTGVNVPHGWACTFSDNTYAAPSNNYFQQSSSTTTTAVVAALVTNDSENYSCGPY
jgi:hypothetical protein